MSRPVKTQKRSGNPYHWLPKGWRRRWARSFFEGHSIRCVARAAFVHPRVVEACVREFMK